MSFNFNGPSFRPMIQESQSMKNNGGGGNTGYFQQGRKKKENKDIDVFADANDQDTFISEDELELQNSNKDDTLINKFLNKTKNIVKNVSEKIPKPSNNPFESNGDA